MKAPGYILVSLAALLMSCAKPVERSAIGQLKNDAKVDLKDEKIIGSLETAIQRLVDLKIKSEHAPSENNKAERSKIISAGDEIELPTAFNAAKTAAAASQPKPGNAGKLAESDQLFEKRTTNSGKIKSAAAMEGIVIPDGPGVDTQTANTIEVVELYKKFLEKYPQYERRDQVLYQISRSYEELGEVEMSMQIINQIIKEYPNSRYIDEFQFRKGEYYFTRKRYLDAEEAYKTIVDMGTGSSYYELALYKLGWALYKQDLYQEALHQFIALLDYKVTIGYDFNRPRGVPDEKRVEDIFRVVSLTFSNLGGAGAIKEYFDSYGKRGYEVNVYGGLGEYYLDKRRYNDAALSYKAFVGLNPYNKASPHMDMRVNEIYKTGGFPKLIIDSLKQIAAAYGLKSEYWKHNEVNAHPEILGYVKSSLKELANYYHALYQDGSLEKNKETNFQEAVKWYREFLLFFPKEQEAPAINYQLADLLLEQKWYEQAAVEYEHIAYDYWTYERAASAGYAAVYAYRESLARAPEGDRRRVQFDFIGSSWKFADTFPQHEKAAAVMAASTNEIYGMKEYNFAVASGRKLLADFPNGDPLILTATLLVIGHSLFDLAQYADAEEAYRDALHLILENDPARSDAIEYFAASLYKQGEQASLRADYGVAAENFFRVAQLAPTTKIRPAADYDGAMALIQLMDWGRAAEVLRVFKTSYSGHELQPEATKKLALIYKETGQLSLAAAEYERIEAEVQDDDIRREALQLAADFYAQANQPDRVLQVHRRYISYFPKPLEKALELRTEIATILKLQSDATGYFNELAAIVEADANAGGERSDRTRYLAATAALALAEPLFQQFVEIKLVQPFDQNLLRKSAAMKTAREAFEQLLNYEVGDVTSAVTYYLAEMFYSFSLSLSESERPDDLNALEKEQYELSIEEQAYPFEEKAIQTHEKNLELLMMGVYGNWIEMSIAKLAKLVPARYAKIEEGNEFIASMETFDYARLIDGKRTSALPIAVPSPQ